MTPAAPYSDRRCRSKWRPSGGLRSTLKSPVWITVPIEVRMASATASGIECVTRIGSISSDPAKNGSRGRITRRSGTKPSECSVSRARTSSSANAGP